MRECVFDYNDLCHGQKNRIASFDVIRAFAFLGVFLYHATRSYPKKEGIPLFFTSGLGLGCVSIFFIVSGYLMTHAYYYRSPRRNLKESLGFAIHKIKKLYFIHLIMLIVGSVWLIRNGKDLIELFKELAVTIPLLQTWFSKYFQAINVVAWYLSVSFFLYFIFPYILPFMTKGKVKELIMKMIIIYTAQIMVGYIIFKMTKINIRWITQCHPLYRSGDFIIGGILSTIHRKIRNNNGIAVSIVSFLEIISVLFFFITCGYHSFIQGLAPWFSYTCIFTPCCAFLVFIFAYDKGSMSGRLKNNRVILWLASISPYGYLIHRLVIYIIYDYASKLKLISLIISIMISFVITLASIYLYLIIEGLCRKFLKMRDYRV